VAKQTLCIIEIQINYIPTVVMCWLRLGLKALALAWLEEIVSRAQSQNSGLAWLGPTDLAAFVSSATSYLKLSLNVFQCKNFCEIAKNSGSHSKFKSYF
jgi:hypothetical protein